MTSSTYLEQQLTQYKRAREGLLCADESNFDHRLAEFVRELRRNALASVVLRALPPSNVQSWWVETLERAETSYAPASLSFPDAEDERLALFADLLAFMAAETGCTAQEFGTVLNCYKLNEAVAVVQELVVQPFCDLLETRLQEVSVAKANRGRELTGLLLAATDHSAETLRRATRDRRA